eukprot:272164_1
MCSLYSIKGMVSFLPMMGNSNTSVTQVDHSEMRNAASTKKMGVNSIFLAWHRVVPTRKILSSSFVGLTSERHLCNLTLSISEITGGCQPTNIPDGTVLRKIDSFIPPALRNIISPI